MLRPTFYLAGPYPKRGALGQLAKDIEGLGLEWQFNWTQGAPAKRGTPEAATAAMCDVAGAIEADLFVLKLFPEVPTKGGMGEMVARASHWKECHVVLDGAPWHLFYSLPAVRLHQTWREFTRWLESSVWGLHKRADREEILKSKSPRPVGEDGVRLCGAPPYPHEPGCPKDWSGPALPGHGGAGGCPGQPGQAGGAALPL